MINESLSDYRTRVIIRGKVQGGLFRTFLREYTVIMTISVQPARRRVTNDRKYSRERKYISNCMLGRAVADDSISFAVSSLEIYARLEAAQSHSVVLFLSVSVETRAASSPG